MSMETPRVAPPLPAKERPLPVAQVKLAWTNPKYQARPMLSSSVQWTTFATLSVLASSRVSRIIQASNLSIFISDAGSKLIVLTMPMANFENFVKELQSLLSLIHTTTSQIFIPTAISHSPINPKSDIIVCLRQSDTVTQFSLDGWFTTDLTKLSKKFVIKKLKLEKTLNAEHMKVKITQNLSQMYDTESLNLIGGFHDAQDNLNMLMFKEDSKQLEKIEIFTEVLESSGKNQKSEEYRGLIEETTNSGHLYQ